MKASNTGTNDLFGVAVSLSADGNTLAVGADGEASSATAGGLFAFFVFFLVFVLVVIVLII